MRRHLVLWLGLVCVTGTSAACSDEPACADFPNRFVGEMSGTMDGAPFAASLDVPHSVYIEVSVQEEADYHGTFHPTQGSQVTSGESFHFVVDCATGDVKEGGGFYENTEVDNYARGYLDGRVDGSGGAGTWSCHYGCDGSGAWSVTPE